MELSERQSQAYSRELEILIVRRHAAALAVAIVLSALFLGLELLFFPGRFPFLMLWLATTYVPMFVLFRCRRFLLRRRVVSFATSVVVATTLLALLGYAALVKADVSIVGAQLAVALLVVAVLLPWSALCQALAAGPPLLGLAVLLWHHGTPVSGVHLFVVVGTASLASISVARHLDVQRWAIFRESRARDEAMVVTRSLLQMARELAAAVDPRTVLDRIVDQTRRILQVDWCAIFLETAEAGTFRLAAGSAIRADLLQESAGLDFRTSDYPTLRGLAEEPGGVLEVSRRCPPDARWRAMMRYFRTRSLLVASMERNRRVVGLLAIGRGGTDEPYPVRHYRILQGFARQASVALENARLFSDLERANRLKSEFVATMSHELRTPLNIVIGYADLIAEGVFGLIPEEAVEPIERIRQESRELLQLIDATLDVNRLESGTAVLDVSEAVLGEFVHFLRQQLERLPRAEGVEFITQVHGEGVIRTDLRKLAIVLRNLVNNAFKFTDRGEVRLEAVMDGDGTVRFTVQDTGVGIPDSEKERVFEMFYQVARSGQSPRGVGLGLYIVRRFIDQLKGRIEMESAEGQGTTFTVTVPSLEGSIRGTASRGELGDGKKLSPVDRVSAEN